jgi:23S rRNA (adenine2503-C2)-methyltransferase
MHADVLTQIRVLEKADEMQSRYYDRQIANKYLFALSDGNRIETTSYRNYINGAPRDFSVDIATMVGCPVGCQFCASTVFKYVRQLSEVEIYAQGAVLFGAYFTEEFARAIFSFQGIGEPSLMPRKIVSASKAFLRLTPKAAISISTTGTNLRAFEIWRRASIPIILQISSTRHFSESVGKALIPKQPGFTNLIREAALCANAPTVAQVKFNYILLEGINDSEEDLNALIKAFAGTPLVVKISSLNHTKSSQLHGLVQASRSRAEYMVETLRTNGIDAFVFGAFNDTSVSCGQLAFEERK